MSKIKQIQGLRALAMCCIFLNHTGLYLSDNISRAILDYFDFLGKYGVWLFFIISGFFVTYKNVVIEEKKKNKDIVLSAWRKISKLYILHLITLGVAFLGKYAHNDIKNYLFYCISFPFNITLTHDFIPLSQINNSFNGPSWFLSALFIVWIIIFLKPSLINSLYYNRIKKLILKAFVTILFLFLYLLAIEEIIINFKNLLFKDSYIPWFIYYSPLLALSQFYLGAILGRLIKLINLSRVYYNFVFILSLLCLFGQLCFVKNIILMPLVDLIILLLFISIIPNDSIGARFLSSSILVWFGNISPYFFLIHGAINYNIRAFVEPFVARPYLFYISFFISLLFSYLAYRLFRRNQSISI